MNRFRSATLRDQQGTGLYVVILAALTLSAALLFGGGSVRGSFQSIPDDQRVEALVSQANYLRNAILNCVITYPTGDNGTAFHKPYPAAATAVAASGITCPGSSANPFTGTGGAGYVPSIPGFGAWQYVNDATSVRLTILDSAGVWTNAQTKAAARFGSQASVAGNTFTLVVSY